MKPVVDRLKKEYAGKVDVRVVDVDSGDDAQKLAGQFGVQYVPTFVFINADGSTAGQVVGEMTEKVLRDKLDALK